MRTFFLPLLFIGSILPLSAETVILYLEPSPRAPVIGTLDTTSEAYAEAGEVEDAEGWRKTMRDDYYSGFIARDSVDADGNVETGTTVLMTPSSQGKVLTTVEEEDQVTVNLVDNWTEITIYKKIPAYFRTPSTADAERRREQESAGRITHAEDPLLRRTESTRYRPSSTSTREELTTRDSRPVAARAMVPVADPMTGFENVENLNPASPRGGYSEADYDSDPDTSASYRDTSRESRDITDSPLSGRTPDSGAPAPLGTSLSNPLSPARIPEELPEGTEAPAAPTENEATEAIEEEQASEIEGRDTLPESEDEGESGEILPPHDPTPNFPSDPEEEMEIIPLVAPVSTSTPAASGSGESADAVEQAAAGAEAGSRPAETDTAEEAVPEEARATILESEEDVEVTVDVEEAILPGVPETDTEPKPQLKPPTDTNRTYVGKLRRTRSFLGMGPDYDFELVNFQNKRIAFVELSGLPMSSTDRFTGKIVRVHGTIEEASDGDNILIRAVNVSLR